MLNKKKEKAVAWSNTKRLLKKIGLTKIKRIETNKTLFITADLGLNTKKYNVILTTPHDTQQKKNP